MPIAISERISDETGNVLFWSKEQVIDTLSSRVPA